MIRSDAGCVKKPDILLVKGNEAVICDVTIFWEGRPLASAYEQKVNYYSTRDFIDTEAEGGG